jgi:hypothetical protein
MKRCILGGLAALVMSAAPITSAPPASAGCQYGGSVLKKCDGPIQPDGTWQRCTEFTHLIYSGASSFLVPERRCDQVGPGQPLGDPPTHIDD